MSCATNNGPGPRALETRATSGRPTRLRGATFWPREKTGGAGLIQCVAADQQREEGSEAAEDGVRLLRLGPRVGAKAVRLVVGEAGDLDLLGLEEGLRRLAVRARERIGHELPRRLLGHRPRNALLPLVLEAARFAGSIAGVLLHELFGRAQSRDLL